MNNKQSLKLLDNAPADVVNLATFYGASSQAGFGSAVVYQQQLANNDLTQLALAKYKYFVGALWERYGADAWLGPWKEVYARKTGIIVELRGITDQDAGCPCR